MSLDPSHPSERLRSLCNSVDAKLVVCSSHLVERLTGVVDTVLPLDDTTIAEAAKLQSGASTTSVQAARSTNAAYIVFTSGSTGKPKVSDFQEF